MQEKQTNNWPFHLVLIFGLLCILAGYFLYPVLQEKPELKAQVSQKSQNINEAFKRIFGK